MQAGEGQRERETQNPKQAPGSEPSARSPTWGSNSRTMRSRPEQKSDAELTEPPRRLSILFFFFKLIYLFIYLIFEKETEREQGRGRERGRDRKSQAGSVLSAQSLTGGLIS